jgi:hypothetical protein
MRLRGWVRHKWRKGRREEGAVAVCVCMGGMDDVREVRV